jgi:hypothetical protein
MISSLRDVEGETTTKFVVSFFTKLGETKKNNFFSCETSAVWPYLALIGA